MPLGRPLKRLGEPDSPDGQVKCKLPRLDRGGTPNDFSSVVKSKLQSYTRTGQACDRCKVRKIRCDALPEGCSHCINQNLECYVTDRVTGRTERRGYMQELEREKTDMLNHIRELEKVLGGNCIEVRPYQWSAHPQNFNNNVAYDAMGNPVQDPSGGGKEQWTQVGNSVWIKNYGQPKTQFGGSSRPLLEPRPADVHLGVGADQAPLHSINGTTLSILGSTIDIGSFDSPDMDEPAPGAQPKSPLYNKSVVAFMQSSTNVNPPLHVDYPPRTDAFTYAEWYFLMIYPFHPILHKPTFMNLLVRLYDDSSFKPTVAEVVQVHLVFASIYLQYGLRNRENPDQRTRLNELSNKHYHFALSKFIDLVISRTLSDLQALTLIAAHTRSFPKPDCSSMITSYCYTMATELGLHRAWKKRGEGTNLENEIRKRLWWTIISMQVTLNGRMGRPMPIRLQEFDVDFPEKIADELLTEDGVDTSKNGKCLYEVGIAGFKMAAIMLEMFLNLYCVRRDYTNYLNIVEELESQLSAWRQEFSELLKSGDGEGNPLVALFAESMALEIQLCIRHPSVAMTKDPKILSDNTRLCGETSKKLLNNVQKLYKLKSIDVTWYALSVYVAAIFSDLAAHWERRHETTLAEVAALRSDMSTWLAVLSETGTLMGSGTGLRDAVSSIVERTIAWIERDQQTKANIQSHVSQDMVKRSPQSGYATLATNAASNSSVSHNSSETNGTPTSAIPHGRNNYYAEPASDSSYPSLGYGDAATHSSSNLPYDPNADNQYLYAQAAGHVTAAAHVQAQADAHAQTQGQSQTPSQIPQHNPLSAFAAQATQMAQPDMMWRQSSSGGNTWQDWTAAVVDNQDRYSANALMSLGGSGRPGSGVNVSEGAADMDMGVSMNSGSISCVNGAPVTSASMQWPLLLFHDSTGVGGA